MDLTTSDYAVISTALFFVSEALALIPAVKANGVFQLIYGILAKLAKSKSSIPMLVVLTLLSGCATSKAPYFCTLATSDEVKDAATEIMKDVKPGTDKDKAELALLIADLSADAGCTAVKAIEAKKAGK